MSADVPLDEVVYFDGISSSSTGAAADADSTPTFAVYEESTDTDIGVGGNMTKRTSLTGNYRGSFTASAANGFELGKWYVVIGSATIGSVATKGILTRFRVVAAEAVAGYPKTDVSHFGGTAGTFSGGRPEVNTSHAAGTAWGSGAITAASIAASALNGKGDWLTTLGTNAPAGWLNAAAFAADCITAAKLASDVTTELQAGLATSAALATAQADITTLVGRLTSARAGYLDNLNVGGVVASQADINAINQSASRRVILTSVGQYERPESGSTTYTIEARTWDGDGAAVNADSNPTLTVTGQTSGSLAANVGAITNPSTGLYRWTYTQSSSATLEPIRIDVSAVIGGSTFPLSFYTQSVDFVSATWTSTNATQLAAIFNKLPSRSYLTGSTSATGQLEATDVRSAVGLSSANLDTSFTNLDTKLGTPVSSVSADIASVKADTGTLTSRITSTLFAGITSVGDWWRRIVRKDAGTAGMIAAEAEIDTGGTSTFSGITDSLEAIRDAGGGGGGGGGDATEANQLLILAEIDTLQAEVEAAIVTGLAVGSWPIATITGFPAELNVGDTYTTDTNQSIVVYMRDADNLPITAVGSHLFTDPDFSATLVVTQSKQHARVEATVDYVDPGGGGEAYLRVQFTSAQTRRASPGAATMQCVLRWTNVEKTIATQSVTWIPRL